MESKKERIKILERRYDSLDSCTDRHLDRIGELERFDKIDTDNHNENRARIIELENRDNIEDSVVQKNFRELEQKVSDLERFDDMDTKDLADHEARMRRLEELQRVVGECDADTKQRIAILERIQPTVNFCIETYDKRLKKLEAFQESANENIDASSVRLLNLEKENPNYMSSQFTPSWIRDESPPNFANGQRDDKIDLIFSALGISQCEQGSDESKAFQENKEYTYIGSVDIFEYWRKPEWVQNG